VFGNRILSKPAPPPLPTFNYGWDILGLVRSFFAHILKHDEHVYRIFTTQVLCALAVRLGAKMDQTAVDGIRDLIATTARDAEGRFQELKDLLHSLVNQSQNQAWRPEESVGLLRGIESVIELARSIGRLC
jgi:hypothetical protein